MHYIRPGEKGTLPVQTIREELVQDIEILPYYAGRKVYIVEDAHKMNVQAQNVLLKTVEEPPEYGVILLLAQSVQSFLPTVRSRCVLLRLLPLAEQQVREILTEQYGIPQGTAAACAAFCEGAVGQALKMAQSQEFIELRNRWMERLGRLVREDILETLRWNTALEADREHIQEILRMMLAWFRDLIILRETGDTGQCICQDQMELLESSARVYDLRELYHKVEVLEDAQKKFNVYDTGKSDYVSVPDLSRPVSNFCNPAIRSKLKNTIKEEVKKEDIVIIRSISDIYTNLAVKYA